MGFNINNIFQWHLFLILFFGLNPIVWSQKNSLTKKPPFQFQQLKTDSLFNSQQVISLIRLSKKDTASYYFDLAHHSNKLFTTSQFATKENAIIAINGGFFNMDKGGSATYLEAKNTIFHKNIPLYEKWAIADWAKTGAIIITKSGQLKLEAAKSPSFYAHSTLEESVLITGPLLINQGEKVNLIQTDFVTQRHPRTCLCETSTAFLLLIVDGRKSFAAGTSLLELQSFLVQQGCVQAINLDGGGSSTMWLKGQGVVNMPSDIFGERKVANAILVKIKT